MAVGNLNSGVGIQPTIIDAKGDLLVGTADNVVDRLGVTGPTGSVLVTDAGETTGLKWVDPGTVGGLVHINTTDFSAVASQSVNDVFSSTYDNYFVLWSLRNSVDGSAVNIRLRVSGTDASGTDYNHQRLTTNGTAVAAVRSTGQTSFATGFGHSTDYNNSSIIIFDPFNAKPSSYSSKHIYRGNSTGVEVYDWGGGHNLSNSYTGLTIFAASGNITGAISVYGYRKS
jgi:hypothetical protein